MSKSPLEYNLDMLLQHYGITGYVREYKFRDDKKQLFDFAWPNEMLAVEVEGGLHPTWVRRKDGTKFKHVGRHLTAKGFTADCEKYNDATILGWTILRVTGDQIMNDKATNWIKAALIQHELEHGS